MTDKNLINKSYFAFGCRYTECNHDWAGELLKVYPDTLKDEHIRQNWIEQFYEVKGFSKPPSNEDKDEFNQQMIGQRYAGVFLASCGFKMPTDDGHYPNRGDLFDLFMENSGGQVYSQLDPLKALSIVDNVGLIFDVKTRKYNGTYPLNPVSGVVGRKTRNKDYSLSWKHFLDKEVSTNTQPPYGYIFCQMIEENGQLLPVYIGWLTHEDVMNYINRVNEPKQVEKNEYYSFEISEMRSIDNLLHTLLFIQKNNKIPNLGPVIPPKLEDPNAGPIDTSKSVSSYSPKQNASTLASNKSPAYSNTEDEVFGLFQVSA